jgi:hypothetical protein
VNFRVGKLFALLWATFALCLGGLARAQDSIWSTTAAQHQVTRETAEAAKPLSVGDSVFRNDGVRTGADSVAKQAFLDSTNLAAKPTWNLRINRNRHPHGCDRCSARLRGLGPRLRGLGPRRALLGQRRGLQGPRRALLGPRRALQGPRRVLALQAPRRARPPHCLARGGRDWLGLR